MEAGGRGQRQDRLPAFSVPRQKSEVLTLNKKSFPHIQKQLLDPFSACFCDSSALPLTPPCASLTRSSADQDAASSLAWSGAFLSPGFCSPPLLSCLLVFGVLQEAFRHKTRMLLSFFSPPLSFLINQDAINPSSPCCKSFSLPLHHILTYFPSPRSFWCVESFKYIFIPFLPFLVPYFFLPKGKFEKFYVYHLLPQLLVLGHIEY